ncbi:DHA2 family efflux MFS transporter permease subunit [Acetobacteraceae bacterium KSS8]|uniref:DHA2 family efflux MFS transporter permease subunit n=1 Tax=Endosaccharibacter trunci TaxID=2812733 RepID=A0ABT1W3G3_9PROT|nr:DHA2 family efflux MFS transporter permease subunit [Acetobacteraceae bacterium KSS8]
MSGPDSAGAGSVLRPGAWLVIAVATLGSFMAQLDATIVNVSLARLSHDLRASLATIQWTMSGYLLALALVLPLNGWLVDRIGSRALYLWSFASFTLLSGLCGLAWSAPSLIVLRLLQGASGGLLAPMAQLTVARIAGKQMPRVSAFMTVPILLAPMLGPAIAGATLQYASWRWLFLLNLPVGVAAFLLAALVLPRDDGERRPRPLDGLGLLLLSPAMVLFLIGADHVSASPGVICLLVSGPLFGAYVCHARRKGGDALIDLRLFRIRGFAVAAASMFTVNGLMFAGQMLVPIFLMRACGLSPVLTGWLMLPLGLGMMATFLLLGRLTDRFGIGPTARTGAILALVGTLPLVLLAETGLSVPLLAASLFVRGVGIGALGVPVMAAGYAAVPRERLSTASTAMNVGQRLGGPTCTTICVVALGWLSPAGVNGAGQADAFAWTFGLLALIHGASLLSTLLLPRALPERT